MKIVMNIESEQKSVEIYELENENTPEKLIEPERTKERTLARVDSSV
jgi:hypothetical protein